MWLEELRSSKDLPVYNERFQEEWEDVNSKTSLSIPAWLSEKIRDGTVTEMVCLVCRANTYVYIDSRTMLVYAWEKETRNMQR